MSPKKWRVVIFLTFIQFISSTLKPTFSPSQVPTKKPSIIPSSRPTQVPSKQPSYKPTRLPTLKPTPYPSQPTAEPSNLPTVSIQPTSIAPSYEPSSEPSTEPSFQPTFRPSQPTITPTKRPTRSPSTTIPTYSIKPSISPTCTPTIIPSTAPPLTPTAKPSEIPSALPTLLPIQSPSSKPTLCPSNAPSIKASPAQSTFSSLNPSCSPASIPTHSPSIMPSNAPSTSPSVSPSDSPSIAPSYSLSTSPISSLSDSPSYTPSCSTSKLPAAGPSNAPTHNPSIQPSLIPTVKSSLSTSTPIIPTIKPSNPISTTLTPSQPTPLSATFQVIQYIRNCSLSSVLSLTGQSVIIYAIFKSMPLVTLGNVTSIFFTDVHNYGSMPLAYTESRNLRIKSTAVSTSDVAQILYTVKFYVPIGSEISAAYNQLTPELTNAVLSGLFTIYLRDHAQTKSVPGLLNAYSDIPPVITSFQLSTTTLAPAMTASPVESPQSTNALSSADVGGIVAGGSIAFILIVLALYATMRRSIKVQVHIDPKPAQKQLPSVPNSAPINSTESRNVGNSNDATNALTEETKAHTKSLQYPNSANPPNALTASKTPLKVDTTTNPNMIDISQTAPDTESTESSAFSPLITAISPTVAETTQSSSALLIDIASMNPSNLGVPSNLTNDTSSSDNAIAHTPAIMSAPQKKAITIAQLGSKYIESSGGDAKSGDLVSKYKECIGADANSGELELRDIDFDDEIRHPTH